MESASVVIPTLNSAATIGELIDALKRQTLKLDDILVIDSSSDDDTVSIATDHGAHVVTIPRREFDHGGTRHTAFLLTKSDFVLFMTQDALPSNDEYVTRLLAPFVNSQVAMVSGRQLPKDDARRFEQLVRSYNYPRISSIRSFADIPKLGIKTFFASDVCSAYRRTSYMKCGGFNRHCRTNEDMLIAASFIRAGYLIAYEATACVVHSHNFSLKQQFMRNKDIGFFLAQHRLDLMNASELGEGKRLLKFVSLKLIDEKQYREVCSFIFDCFARLSGNKTGKLLYRINSRMCNIM